MSWRICHEQRAEAATAVIVYARRIKSRNGCWDSWFDLFVVFRASVGFAVVFIDWDNSALATYAMALSDLGSVLNWHSFDQDLLSSLKALEDAFYKFMVQALSLTRIVFIITNATAGWVELTCQVSARDMPSWFVALHWSPSLFSLSVSLCACSLIGLFLLLSSFLRSWCSGFFRACCHCCGMFPL